jgi:hypothetical protein
VSTAPAMASDARLTTVDSMSSYHCQICNRPFKRLDLLQRHEKRAICGDEAYARKRPRSESSDDSPRVEIPPDTPKVEVSIPPPTANNGTTAPAATAPFIVDNTSMWGFGQWPLESWEEVWNDVLAPPFGEPSPTLNLPFNITAPRMQQSSERGGQVSLASGSLVARLQRAYPVSVTMVFCLMKDARHRS